MQALPRQRTEQSVPGPTRPARAIGVTPRAVLLGALLIPLQCFWVIYSEVVAMSTEMAVMSLSISVVFLLLILLGINALLRRWLPRLVFSQAELLFIYAMQTVSIGICGVGMMQFLCMGIANVFYFATPENGWQARYQPLLHRWAFPHPSVLPDFYLGRSSFFTREHLAGWLSPILAWSAFIVIVLFVMLCLNVVLRRRWVEHERLTFPIVILPLELTRAGGSKAFFTNRLMWAGFSAAFVLEMLAGLAFLHPSIPFLPLKPSDPRLNLTENLKGIFGTPPWNAVGELDMGFYPMVIGLAYFLPLDVSFSCWFFFLARKLEEVLTVTLGFRDPGAGPALARMPYIGEQGGGAFLGLALFSLWSARGYLKQAAQTALNPQAAPLDDRREPLSYRGALLGAAAGFVALVAFTMALGLSPLPAAAFFLLFFLVVIAYTRIRAEAGLPWAFGPDMTPHQMIIAAGGTTGISTPHQVALTQLQWMDLDYRCTAMPHQLEAMKIASETRMNQRHLFGVIVLATVIGALSSWLAILTCYYKYGAATAHVDSWRTSMGNSPWDILSGWQSAFSTTDYARLIGVGTGLLMTGLLMAARARFLWWPFHPIGYVLAGGFTLVWLWGPLFVGWLVKWCLLRYGGLKLYRAALPFFIGLILGDYVAGSIWALYGCVTGVQTYRVVPI